MRRIAWIVVLGLAAAADAKTISITIGQRAELRGENLAVKISVGNTGDESAKADRLGFAPAVRISGGVHVPTWLGWMVRAVKAGYARVVSGSLPDAVPAECQPRVYSSMSQGPRKDDKDATIEKLTALLVAKLSPAERKELAAVLGK